MKNLFKSLIVIGLLSIAIQSCKKYPEGPALSLRSKEARLTGKWKLDKIYENGIEYSAFFILFGGTFEWEIEKGGKYHIHLGTDDENGTWKLSGDKEELIFLGESSGAQEERFTILKLKNKELWLKSTDSNGDVTEIRLKQ